MKKSIFFCFLILVLISTFVSASDRDTYFENIKFGMNTNEVMTNIDLEIKDIRKEKRNNINFTTLIYQADVLNSKGMYFFSFANNRLAITIRGLFTSNEEAIEYYKKTWGMDIRLLDGANYIKKSKEVEDGFEIFELDSPNYLGGFGIVNSNKVDLSKIDIPEEIDVPSELNYLYFDQIISKNLIEEMKK